MKRPRLKRMHIFLATEHIRVLRSIADEVLSPKETVRAERDKVIYNPFGFKNKNPDPDGSRRKELVKLWPLHSDVIQVHSEGDSLLVYTAIV